MNIWRFSCFSGFRISQGSYKQRESRKFILYSIYAWGCSSLLTLFCCLMESLPNIPDNFIKPDFNKDKCWFQGKFEQNFNNLNFLFINKNYTLLTEGTFDFYMIFKLTISCKRRIELMRFSFFKTFHFVRTYFSYFQDCSVMITELLCISLDGLNYITYDN